MLEKIKSLFIPSTFTLSNGKVVKEKFNPTIYIVIGLAYLIYITGQFTGFNFSTLAKNGSNFFDIIIAMFPPNLAYSTSVISPMIDTLIMSLVGTLIGVVFALPMAFLNATNLNKNKWLVSILRTFLSLLRTIPVLVYALISVYIFGVGAFSGTVAIAIFTFAIASKMLYEQVETVDMGPFEALESTGANTIRSVRCAVFPQIKPYYISMILYNFEMNVRSAAILGYVGAGGIGILLNENLGWRAYQKVGTVLIMLIIVVLIIESTSRYLRGKLN
ncbi:MAG: phosphonate ABC transporter, permease protein PhnE [Erysipelotrichaceae bacterium]